ncbi:MAG: ATP-binding protein [Pseudomonadota bacterium]|nr:ATP-binding protein [Pseudomonadota bacterium]
MHRAPSLSGRLAAVAVAVLAGFFGLTGIVLDGAFRQSVEEGIRENLQVQVYLMLGAADVDEDGELRMPDTLSEPRLSSPTSGLYATVADTEGKILWRSDSSLGRDIPYPAARISGEPVYSLVSETGNRKYFALSHLVTWELTGGGERELVFRVAQAGRQADAQIRAFRRTLWTWLVAAAAVLLIAQAAALHWGLAPLRRAAREIREIEQGQRGRLGGNYPKELLHLTQNLNALLESGASRLQRYRDSLADLAHSLKTPLAVLRSVAGEEAARAQRGSIMDQVERMDQAIDYHLQRGAAAGRSGLSSTVHPDAILARIGRSLAKVYAEKRVELEVEIADDAVFAGDEGDLTEILGNLLDNAYKWCRERVRVRARTAPDPRGRRSQLLIEIEDDGPGIPEPDRRAVLERGVRTDRLVPGQGLGLAVVREMVEEAYAGSLELSDSDLGGARIRVIL